MAKPKTPKINPTVHSTFFIYWELAYESKEYATEEEAREAMNGIITEAGEDLKVAQMMRKVPCDDVRMH